MFSIDQLLRENIRNLTPYSSARDEYSGEEAVFLDANENPYNTGANRYPDPLQLKLKVKIGQLKNVHYENIFLGNGSDEPIDLLMRAFCEPRKDNIISIKPSYGMYKVAADTNNIELREVMLSNELQLNVQDLLDAADANSKILFLCSPNNPTSNSLNRDDMLHIVQRFDGIVAVDEAYIDFTNQQSLLSELENYPNLVILQTLSKAWGMAGIRLGMAFGSRELIAVLTRIKYPYNINRLTQEFALNQLEKEADMNTYVEQILSEREKLNLSLQGFTSVKGILPSDANFLMVRFENPKEVFRFLLDRKIIVRDRSKVPLCEGCLRVTVGTKEENAQLLKALQEYENQ